MPPRLFQADIRLHTANAALAVSSLVLATWILLSTDPLSRFGRTSTVFIRSIGDFVIHLSVYAVITLSLMLPISHCRSDVRRVCLALLMVHAVITELLQTMIPRRVCDPIDMLANCLGIGLAIMATGQWTRIMSSQRQMTS